MAEGIVTKPMPLDCRYCRKTVLGRWFVMGADHRVAHADCVRALEHAAVKAKYERQG